MAEYLAEYGFPMDYLQNVVNHKQLKFIRDSWQQNERMKRALAAVRSGKPDKRPASKPGAKPPLKNPVSSTGKKSGDTLADVFSQL